MSVRHHSGHHKRDRPTSTALWKHHRLLPSFVSSFLSQIWECLLFFVSIWLVVVSSVPELSCGQRAVLIPRPRLFFWEMPEANQTANILHYTARTCKQQMLLWELKGDIDNPCPTLLFALIKYYSAQSINTTICIPDNCYRGQSRLKRSLQKLNIVIVSL